MRYTAVAEVAWGGSVEHGRKEGMQCLRVSEK